MTRPDRSILSNAGRCDICGRTIDMRDDGDTLSLQEFGVSDEVAEEHGISDRDAAEAVADALESVAESPQGLELARVIREQGAIRVHEACLAKTNHSTLPTATEAER